MTISIHLISVPSDEVVTSRVIYLPEAGGEFGRSTSCDIALPDQSKRISRVHGNIRRTEVGYSVKSTGQNAASLNDKAMVRDKDYPLNDGDILKVESYTMLVSTLVSTKPPQDRDEDSAMFSEPFSLQIDNDDTDFLDETAPSVSNEKKGNFTQEGVLTDDPFAADPFEDLEDVLISQHIEKDEPDSNPVHQASDPELLPASTKDDSPIETSLEKILSITEKNQKYLANPTLHHELLFKTLDQTVDQFLNDFSPNQLEKQFDGYISGGIFTSKQKKYWRIYRKHFQHRQDNGDFRRQFKALFMENMQKNREEK
ncbi:FHA domain-containing protein [Vibrio aquimaris]|uniref:FHA domain protein n=1 Tax=Vibrio aquimaris TaxID=2587862 RepID=A0A5P9CIT6_9VIBR|nr:FHA domain-containing protein [Vibrio aquimaris]QFT26144.1 FHA domain protein [Vibrio aquimaris]